MSKSARTALITGIAAGAIGLIASIMPRIQEFEEAFGQAVLYAVRGPAEAPANIVVVSIDSESAEALGLEDDRRRGVELTDWPRSLHADLVRILDAAGVKLIAFDVHFRVPGEEASDRALVAAVETAGFVILFDRIEQDVQLPDDGRPGLDIQITSNERIPAFPLLDAAALASAPFPLPDFPARVYQYWAFAPQANDAPTLPVVAFNVYADDALQALVGRVREIRPHLLDGQAGRDIETLVLELRRAFLSDSLLADQLLDDLADGRLLADDSEAAEAFRSLIDLYTGDDGRYLDFYGPPRTIRTVPIHEILQDGIDPEIDWNGAAVLVGFSDRIQANQDDDFLSVYSQRSGLSLSGVEIAATALANLVENKRLQFPTIPTQLLLVVLIGLVFGACYLMRSALAASLSLGLALIVYLGVVQLQFNLAGLVWPVLIPLLMQAPLALILGMSQHYRRAQARQAAVSRGVSRYLPPDLVERIAENTGAEDRASELVFGTCMVSDMENFTAFAEGKSLRSLEAALNAYYETLFGIVDENRGLVTDIVGDSMVAVWKLASDRDKHAANAVAAAIEISARLSGSDEGFPKTRIGLHSGEFVLGAVGAEEHLEYRAVGDVVNSASRLQALNKHLGTTVLSTQETIELAMVSGREIGKFKLAGKEFALDVIEPLGPGESLSESLKEKLARFSNALEAFRKGDWERALELFSGIERDFAGDGPSKFYVRYITGMIDTSLDRRDRFIRIAD